MPLFTTNIFCYLVLENLGTSLAQVILDSILSDLPGTNPVDHQFSKHDLDSMH